MRLRSPDSRSSRRTKRQDILTRFVAPQPAGVRVGRLVVAITFGLVTLASGCTLEPEPLTPCEMAWRHTVSCIRQHAGDPRVRDSPFREELLAKLEEPVPSACEPAEAKVALDLSCEELIRVYFGPREYQHTPAGAPSGNL